MDWSVVGGNPVPVEVGSILGGAGSLRRSARELQRWQHDAQALFGRTGTVWTGRAGVTYAHAGIRTVRQSAGWNGRLRHAADALVRFAGEIEALNTRASELAGRAASYLAELHAIEIDQWYTIKLGISGWVGDDSAEQLLQIRLDAVRRLVEQVRSDFAVAERRVVQAIAEQLGAVELIRPGSLLSASQQAALATLAVDETAGWFPVTSRLLAAMGSAQVAAMFADLTPAAIRALALSDPAGIGNLDGVPLYARAMANQLLLERDRQLAEAAGDSTRLTVLDELIAAGGSLVVYQPALARYGVLFGDQRARHVAVLVPGVGSDARLGGWIGDAYSVWARSPESAVIMWKGYDDHGIIPDAVHAGFNARAEKGARGLAGFADGLALANNQSLTVIAHGYGTVLTGLAMARDGLAPANVVALGSPDPSWPVFSGTQLATNVSGMPAVQGHSQYFARDSPVLDGIAQVVTGSLTQAELQVADPATDHKPNGAPMTVQPAINRLAEAERLVAELVRAVAPEAVPGELLPARKLQPQPGTDTDLVYYTFDRQFEAGATATGASLVPAIESQLKARGFSTHDPGPTGGWVTRTARNGQLGLDLLGAPAAGTVRIGVDTQCGLP